VDTTRVDASRVKLLILPPGPVYVCALTTVVDVWSRSVRRAQTNVMGSRPLMSR
jgi:hypothetical protein